MQPSVTIPGFDITPIAQQTGNWLVGVWPTVVSIAVNAIHWIVVISFPGSLFFLSAIIYSAERLKVIKKKESAKHDLKVETAEEDVPGQKGNDLGIRWRKV